jgi:hypothetical protein
MKAGIGKPICSWSSILFTADNGSQRIKRYRRLRHQTSNPAAPTSAGMPITIAPKAI